MCAPASQAWLQYSFLKFCQNWFFSGERLCPKESRAFQMHSAVPYFQYSKELFRLVCGYSSCLQTFNESSSCRFFETIPSFAWLTDSLRCSSYLRYSRRHRRCSASIFYKGSFLWMKAPPGERPFDWVIVSRGSRSFGFVSASMASLSRLIYPALLTGLLTVMIFLRACSDS